MFLEENYELSFPLTRSKFSVRRGNDYSTMGMGHFYYCSCLFLGHARWTGRKGGGVCGGSSNTMKFQGKSKTTTES